ncbi:unnamed protein product [Brachionus calyciflorus]|uniref:MULE transposase domain-containing protein n=1 Tax=Brachionus calyciflorus TaxID=104777 RepID=A0A814KZ82_9BILA|nr:unnamed protein product [Brachionus calyciflorus]
MRKKIDWIFLANLGSDVEVEYFFREFPKASSSHTNSNNCTLCRDNSDLHSITTIEETETKLKHGISKKFKKIIEQYIYRNISIPLSIYHELLLANNEGHRKPALIQIQNYLKYRRQKHGEVNSIDRLLEYVQPKLFSNIEIVKYAIDLPFYFGAEINEGYDDSHFHLGITSKQLLANIFNACTFHFDCTYKIVKYGFPVMVFGCTDIRRKFYPICYCVTSHEQEQDFTFFWNSLIEVCKQINIDLVKSIS